VSRSPAPARQGRRPPARFSPERQLVLECVRRCFAAECGSRAEPAPEPEPDWDEAVELAFQEGLAPLVYQGLASAAGPVPAAARAKLRAGHAGAALRAEAVVEPTLRGVLDALGRAGIEPIVLKGAALAYTAYSEPAHRAFADVDLLLAKGELDEASRALLGLGFAMDGEEPEAGHHLRPHYAPGWQAGVELHRSLLPEPNPYALDVGLLRARSAVRTIAGVEARVLAASDALLLACLHLAYAHRYRWFALRGLIDVLAITTRLGAELDWDALLATVAASRTAGAVYWPLRLGRAWLGAPVPERVLSSLAPPAPMRRLVAAVATPRYILDGEAPARRGSEVLYSLLLDLSLYSACPPGEQLGAAFGRIFPPREHVGHLPAALARSPLRYAAYLGSPRRMARGLTALGRLVRRALAE